MPKLAESPIHLGRGAVATAEPSFDGMQWYADYSARHADDGAEGRLVSWGSWTADWPSWEMHPAGDEVVVCIDGAVTLIQEYPDGRTEQVTLGAGDYAINPPGVWHTADIADHCTGLFITAGEGTQHRPR